jgi:hypothetical protein
MDGPITSVAGTTVVQRRRDRLAQPGLQKARDQLATFLAPLVQIVAIGDPDADKY